MTYMPQSFYDGRWDQGNVPIKLRGARLEDYEAVHTSGKIARMKAQDFVDNFTNYYVSAKAAANGDIPQDRSTVGRGFMLYGRNGTRKTTLAAAILTEVQYKSPSNFGFYIRFSDWKDALTATYEKVETEKTLLAKKRLQLAELSPLVILDDIGQEYRTQSGFTESQLHEFLRRRYEAARPTIVTTNIDPVDLIKVYGQSFDSFRHDAFETLEILGRDSRKTKD